MAAITRQPFAPLNESRLQNLTSLKNRQNAINTSPPSASKRKADLIYTDDSENVDPLLSAKRSKAARSSSKDGICKPTNHVLKATPKPVRASTPMTSPRRALQQAKSSSKLNSGGISKSSPLATPAGRSPTRGKKSGILSSRRSSGAYRRLDPPSFNSGAPFSLDAALKGTISSYTPTPKAAPAAKPAPSKEPDMKASWFFDIHEDTPEQEMTNLLQHSTCVLDISSDEESAQRARRVEKEDKENVPPVDDVSQTSRRVRARMEDEMVIEKERVALGEMKTEDFWAEGCDETSVVLVPDDEEEQPKEAELPKKKAFDVNFEFAPELKALPPVTSEEEAELEAPQQENIDLIMGSRSEESSKAAVLQPMDGTGETFELWESGSSKDEGEAVNTSEASS